jgi:hypothetical protein
LFFREKQPGRNPKSRGQEVIVAVVLVPEKSLLRHTLSLTNGSRTWILTLNRNIGTIQGLERRLGIAGSKSYNMPLLWKRYYSYGETAKTKAVIAPLSSLLNYKYIYPLHTSQTTQHAP